jgi:dCMP deaminase
MKTDWNKRFIELTKHIATWSKDKSTGVAALIADDDKRIVSVGYNGFPTGCDDEKEERHQRPAKYLYTEHAERNAIYNAARIGVSVKDCTMYLMWFPCVDCTRAIIQSGIKKLVCTKPDLTMEKWGEQFVVALEMLEEVGIEIVYID